MRMHQIIFFAAVLFLALPAFPEGIDLTGVWECNDGGRYYLRQVGDGMWWYGESSPMNPDWSNIAHGKVVKQELKLDWIDVPKGGAENHGTLTIRIVSADKLELKGETGGFSGSEWSRAKED